MQKISTCSWEMENALWVQRTQNCLWSGISMDNKSKDPTPGDKHMRIRMNKPINPHSPPEHISTSLPWTHIMFPVIFSYWKLKYLGVSVGTCISVGEERGVRFLLQFLPACSMALIGSGSCPLGPIGMYTTQSKPAASSATWILQVPIASLALPESEHSSHGWNQ